MMIVVQARVLDSTHLELLEPIELDHNRTVMVMIAEEADADAESRQWTDASCDCLRDAYADADPEYDSSCVREVNPEYRA